MELTASVLGIVEAVAPVNTEQTDHRQEDTHAYAGAALDLERIEVLDVAPAVSAFEKSQHEDSGRRLEDYGIAQLHGVFGEDIASYCNAIAAFGGK